MDNNNSKNTFEHNVISKYGFLMKIVYIKNNNLFEKQKLTYFSKVGFIIVLY